MLGIILVRVVAIRDFLFFLHLFKGDAPSRRLVRNTKKFFFENFSYWSLLKNDYINIVNPVFTMCSPINYKRTKI